MINLAFGIIAGMKRFGDLTAFPDDNVLRQQTVQGFLKNIRFQIGLATEMGNLTQCMHTGIGAAGSVDAQPYHEPQVGD